MEPVHIMITALHALTVECVGFLDRVCGPDCASLVLGHCVFTRPLKHGL